MKLPSISCCMIVRDEEKDLPRALASVAKIADEIVVVDTGSKDATVEIAERFGAKVYLHPWQSDFSLHRNQSLDYATGDWLFQFDADEEAVTNLPMTAVKRKLADVPANVDALLVDILDIRNGKMVCRFKFPRLFRKGKAHFEGKIHNRLIPDGDAAVCDFLTIKHYGYAPGSKRDDRTEQTLAMLYAETETDPHAWFYLGELYGMKKLTEKSAECFEKYWACKDQVEALYPALYYAQTRNYLVLGEKEKAKEWIERGMAALPQDPDMAYALMDYGCIAGNSNAIQNGGRMYWALVEQALENPEMIKGFTFTVNKECFALAAYRLAVLSINQWKTGWDKLLTLWPEISEGARKEIGGYARQDLKRIGIEGLTLPGQEIEPQAVDAFMPVPSGFQIGMAQNG